MRISALPKTPVDAPLEFRLGPCVNGSGLSRTSSRRGGKLECPLGEQAQLFRQQLPVFLVAFLIVELFYKFHSFALECAALERP